VREPAVEILQPRGNPADSEAALHERTSIRRETIGTRTVGQKVVDFRSKDALVTGGSEHSRLAVVDDHTDVQGLEGGDRSRYGHRLEYRDADETFDDPWLYVHVGRFEDGPYICNLSQKADLIRDAKLTREILKTLAFGPLADNHKASPRLHLGQVGCHAQELVVTLTRVKRTNRGDERISIAYAKTSSFVLAEPPAGFEEPILEANEIAVDDLPTGNSNASQSSVDLG